MFKSDKGGLVLKGLWFIPNYPEFVIGNFAFLFQG